MTAIEQLEEFLGQFDADLRFETASECAWSGQLRFTLTNPDQRPSRSITFFTAGAMGPEHAAQALLADARAWLEESGERPLPVPDWMK